MLTFLARDAANAGRCVVALRAWLGGSIPIDGAAGDECL